MIRLGVNIDHIATLREVRKASFPSLIQAATVIKRAGAHQITIHLREDRRHIQDADLKDLLEWGELPINLEMALTDEMVEMAVKFKPACITLVPEKRREMTTESGLDLRRCCGDRQKKVSRLLERLRKGSEISAFIDADPRQVRCAAFLGFQAVEFHTGTLGFAACNRVRRDKTLLHLQRAAEYADQQNLEVRAGHGLNEQNIDPILTLPHLREVNIGHSIVCEAVFVGLEDAVRRLLKLLRRRPHRRLS